MTTSARRKRTLILLGDIRVGFVDIGAREGIPQHWAWLSRALDTHAFEPDKEEASKLSGDTRAVAVSGSTGTGSLLLTRSPGCSSLLPPNRTIVEQYPNPSRFDVVEEQAVNIVTLDEIFADLSAPNFIKIDTQGTALSILRGATEALEQTVGLEVESEFLELYQGEDLFGPIHQNLRETGFEIVDIRGTYWRRKSAENIVGCKGQMVFCDALYMRTPDSLAEKIKANPDPIGALLRAFAICEVYHLADYIVAYAAACDLKDERIEAWVAMAKRRPVLARMSKMPLARHLGMFLMEVGDLLSGGAWAYSSQSLGNKPRHEKLGILR